VVSLAQLYFCLSEYGVAFKIQENLAKFFYEGDEFRIDKFLDLEIKEHIHAKVHYVIVGAKDSSKGLQTKEVRVGAIFNRKIERRFLNKINNIVKKNKK